MKKEDSKLESDVISLKKMVDVQCQNGNWNYSEYMFGMANGMIFALSIFTNEEPVYLSKPDSWLCDNIIVGACVPSKILGSYEQ